MRTEPAEKAVISVYGIRGIGSFYYLAYALGQARFEEADTLWLVVCLVVLFSIVLHGTTVTAVMVAIDHRNGRASSAENTRVKQPDRRSSPEHRHE
ncbi:hypothetical protein [Nitratireductor sp. ZSWI3]|uniref:hypothetical protein n=1 Tax=Nitratireductor sp. ZSWI3 TaxID=2966359 RepID=UPI00214FF8C4|nr:hypothetical protein [Nitratireductor sp. ZSWI3]MCR4264672.1 hypothetical protein [Nitratireductor sp. ZSWI3]